MILSAALTPDRPNNLHALRLLAAAAVVVSHAWPLAHGAGTAEPLVALTGHSLGGWAVAVFFFLSGLLIAQSAARRTARAFWAARARRILPGLTAALLATLALATLSGGAVTPPVAADYLLRGLTLVSLEHAIPGAFAANPMPLVVNGPLWSLFHEVAAYALCFAAVRSGLVARWPLVLPALALALWAAPDLPARADTFAPLFLCFAAGMTVWRFRDTWPVTWPVLAVLAACAPVGWPLAVAALGQAVLLLAFRTPPLPLRADLSFGVYLLGWPVAQYVLHLAPGLTAPHLAAVSLAATLPLAGASWHLIERPSLTPRAHPA
ncbi:MAG TPA: acyltransferase family protein [Paracoccaceae bacterium]|nr:acyltransferase family protein [Paracoccaceae bacterium]